MKNVIKTILILITTISCKAQTKIIDIDDDNGDQIYGAYYKDTNNQLDAFVGTYIYTNGNETLKIVFQKKIMSTRLSHQFYSDMIIGEYQHIINGVEVRNTLNKLNVNYTDQELHSISGNMLIKGTELGCPECGATEKRLRCGIIDDVSNSLGWAQIRRIIVNGQPAIRFNLYWEMSARRENDPPQKATSPYQGKDYIMIKQ